MGPTRRPEPERSAGSTIPAGRTPSGRSRGEAPPRSRLRRRRGPRRSPHQGTDDRLGSGRPGRRRGAESGGTPPPGQATERRSASAIAPAQWSSMQVPLSPDRRYDLRHAVPGVLGGVSTGPRPQRDAAESVRAEPTTQPALGPDSWSTTPLRQTGGVPPHVGPLELERRRGHSEKWPLTCIYIQSGREDSNLRPLDPQSSALTKLRHGPGWRGEPTRRPRPPYRWWAAQKMP